MLLKTSSVLAAAFLGSVAHAQLFVGDYSGDFGLQNEFWYGGVRLDAGVSSIQRYSLELQLTPGHMALNSYTASSPQLQRSTVFYYSDPQTFQTKQYTLNLTFDPFTWHTRSPALPLQNGGANLVYQGSSAGWVTDPMQLSGSYSIIDNEGSKTGTFNVTLQPEPVEPVQIHLGINNYPDGVVLTFFTQPPAFLSQRLFSTTVDGLELTYDLRYLRLREARFVPVPEATALKSAAVLALLAFAAQRTLRKVRTSSKAFPARPLA